VGGIFEKEQSINDYLFANRASFEEALLEEAVNVRHKIVEFQEIANINLLENAHRLVLYVVEQKKEQVRDFAAQEGVIWAKYSMTLSFKLEWIQAIRRTLWKFLREYDTASSLTDSKDDIYILEGKINELIDEFINTFFVRYSAYKDALIEEQKKLVENLSVPIIPINEHISVLPLIGDIDDQRLSVIEEKVLHEIDRTHVETLIMDLSGVSDMEAEVVTRLFRIIEGIALMGCKSEITGLRPDFVRKVIHAGVSFEQKAETRGTLQQTLRDYLIVH
jgi:anti-anti-sigma regulatory factor